MQLRNNYTNLHVNALNNVQEDLVLAVAWQRSMHEDIPRDGWQGGRMSLQLLALLR